MKKQYNAFLTSIQNLIIWIEINKMRAAEQYALYVKKKLYNSIKWDKQQKKIFDNYWVKNYGTKITSNGHKLYESLNGIYHIDYMPDFLFATKVEPFFNPYFYAKLYSDKSLTEILYAKSKLVNFPKTFLVNSGGLFYDNERNIIGKDKAKLILSSLSEVVIKPTVGGNSGKGVMVCKFVNGYDKNYNFSILDLVDNGSTNFIVQEKMKQHQSIAKIYNNSINTFRTITYVLDGVIYVAKLVLRIGSGGGNVDNIHAGGLGIGVNNDGTLLKYAYKLGYSDSAEKLKSHPDSGLVFEKHKVSGTDKIIECAKELHGLTPHLGMISWDFMVSEDESPVLIEANYWGQAVWLTQIVHSSPFFGDQTESILKVIGEKF